MQKDHRRRFLLASGALLAAPLLHAQQPGRTYRIGMVWIADAATVRSAQEAFLAGLREFRFEQGRNLVVDVRNCDGDQSKLPTFVDELIALKPDVLVGLEQVALVMRRKTNRIPIVLTTSNDPVAAGLVQSFARPGTNVTGMAVFSPQIGAKTFELMTEILPRLRTIAQLLDPGVPVAAELERAMRAAASAKGARLVVYYVKDKASLEQAFAEMERNRPDGLLGTGGSGMLYGFRRLIAESALRLRIPVSGGVSGQSEAGFLFSYGAKTQDVFHRAASHAARILNGADPRDLPIEQPTIFELVINLKTAKALDITIPQSVLARADRVIV